jgi:hypothetical protein
MCYKIILMSQCRCWVRLAAGTVSIGAKVRVQLMVKINIKT